MIDPKIAAIFGIARMNPWWLKYNLVLHETLSFVNIRSRDTSSHIVMAMQGRFYFGELLEEEHGCTVDICAVVTHFSLSLSLSL